MYQLVYEKRDDIFTDSLVIAQETGNRHINVKELIVDYQNEFKQLGTFSVLNRESRGGRPEQYYELNEPQASFLLTLMRNSTKVVAFKLALVKEFYRMRQALMERRTTDWLQTRKNGKLIRRIETDAIQQLIPYAEEQGSKNMAKQAYCNYSKLVNDIVGLKSKERDKASYKQLMTVAMLEDMLQNTINEEMRRGVYYKTIYQICKRKAEQFSQLMYLGKVV